MGTHARRQPRRYGGILLATASALTLTLGGLLATAAAATTARPVHPAHPAAYRALTIPLADGVQARARAAPRLYTVRPVDTLSALASRLCGHAADWTGYYAANRAVIGADPNLILPGQRLNLSRCTDPPALLRLAVTRHAAVHTAVRHDSGGRVWGVTFGYPNRCGDGDGDGWDVACATRHHATASASHTASRSSSAAAVSYAGHYSYAGLEQLWISAGGPSWAAAHAASIAECESGGNTTAYNPSGATGLWQILGQVVGGNLDNPYTNALNAVSKFKASGDTFAQWVCQ